MAFMKQQNNARESSQDFIKKLLIAERQKIAKEIFKEIRKCYQNCEEIRKCYQNCVSDYPDILQRLHCYNIEFQKLEKRNENKKSKVKSSAKCSGLEK